MGRMRVALGALAVVLAAGSAQAEKLSLQALSGYLNALKTAQGAFTQINADGTVSTGTVYIHRPGRMRFEYNAPDDLLVIAGGSAVAIFDGKTRQPETYPLGETPLSIILAKDVDLGRARMVTGHASDGVKTTVRAQDPDHPEYGSIELVFTANPVELRQWVITDSSGTQTTVVLGDMQTGGSLGASLFSIKSEVDKRE